MGILAIVEATMLESSASLGKERSITVLLIFLSRHRAAGIAGRDRE